MHHSHYSVTTFKSVSVLGEASLEYSVTVSNVNKLLCDEPVLPAVLWVNGKIPQALRKPSQRGQVEMNGDPIHCHQLYGRFMLKWLATVVIIQLNI